MQGRYPRLLTTSGQTRWNHGRESPRYLEESLQVPPPSISLVKQKRPMQCIFQSHDNEFLGVFHNNKRDNQLSIPFTNVRPEKLYPRLISQQYLSPLHTEWMYKKSMIIRFDFKGNLFFSALDLFNNIEVTETIY